MAVTKDRDVYHALLTCLLLLSCYDCVTLAAFLTISPMSVSVVSPDPAMFSCTVDGVPRPNITWLRVNNGTETEVLENSFVHINITTLTNGSTSVLTFSETQPSMSGVYVCLARNMSASAGEMRSNATLTVYVTPQINNTSSQTEVRLGTPAVLACLATGFPIPSISWSKDGEEVNIYSESSLSSRIDVIEFAANSMVPTGSNDSDFQSSGYMGRGSIVSLLVMHTSFSVDQVLQLGEFGVVGLLSFENTVRRDNGNYTCNATNNFPKNTTLGSMSDIIPLVILESPDPPLNVSAFEYGARWITLRWSPSYDGNRPVTNFSVHIRSVDGSVNFTLSLSADDLTTTEGNVFTLSDSDRILPYTNYSFTVVSCNEIGCSDQSDPSPVIRTNQDASSPPVELMGEPNQTSISLTWSEPNMPNGVITHYNITFNGIRAQAGLMPHTGLDDMQMTVSELVLPTGRLGTTLTDLFPNTQYEITVFAINGAGSGMAARVNTTTLNETNASNTSNIIAPVVAVITVFIVLAAVIVTTVIVILCVKRHSVNNLPKVSGNGHEIAPLNYYVPPVQGATLRHPIPLSLFPSHVEWMSTNENCGFVEEYNIIEGNSPQNSADVSNNLENNPRNRYTNIRCFDKTRVVLTPIKEANHDYINANFIDGYNRPKEYIAAQGPLPDTLGDFWRMIWDYNVPTIVMLTNLVEKAKVKCSQYWPETGHQEFADIKVTLVNTVTQADFVVRCFQIEKTDSREVRNVQQIHFISWPDYGVPRHPTPLLHALHRVRNMHTYSNERPLVIHCSAGVGRTGTLITIDVELQRAMKEGVVDPFNCVTKLREQRNFMVQTETQYVFLHDAILEGVTSGTTEVKVEKLSQKFEELEKEDEERETGFQKEYSCLKKFKVDVKEFTNANDDANKFKNRIFNALPYDYNRVHLQMSPGVAGSDYINASYIDGNARKGCYIATQGPLPNTINDFWRMVWEDEVHVIVMLTQLEEKGKKQCAQYWPDSVNSPKKSGSLSIELLSEKQFQSYTLRELKVSSVTNAETDDVTRTVKQYHFTAWPEDGAPSSGAGMIDLIDQVTRTQAHTGNKPIVVHCSAGIGRTGVFCVMSVSIDRVKTEGVVDVFHCVKHLRTQRPHIVQSLKQYVFCYVAIREYVESFN